MMKINNSTFKNAGNQNPFTVPEGYFENLTDRIMDSLPEKESKKEPVKFNLRKIAPWISAAAMICGIAFGIRFYVNYDREQADNISAAQRNSEPISLAEEDILVSSVSNYELYEYLMYESGDNF